MDAIAFQQAVGMNGVILLEPLDLDFVERRDQRLIELLVADRAYHVACSHACKSILDIRTRDLGDIR